MTNPAPRKLAKRSSAASKEEAAGSACLETRVRWPLYRSWEQLRPTKSLLRGYKIQFRNVNPRGAIFVAGGSEGGVPVGRVWHPNEGLMMAER